MDSRKRNFIICSAVVATVLLIVSCNAPSPFPRLFEIENLRMTNTGADVGLCDSPAILRFDLNQEIYVSWTEVGRKEQSSLVILIFNEKDGLVFKYEEAKSPYKDESRKCRILPVRRNLRPGFYQTEFVIDGHTKVNLIFWEILQPTPTPTATPLPTATPTPTATPLPTATPTPTATPRPAIPPPFSIERPRMTVFGEDKNPCELDSIFELSASDRITIAWTEVGRSYDTRLVIYIYDQQGNEVFRHRVDEQTSSGEIRTCKYLIVNKALEPGKYRTLFVLDGRPSEEAIDWVIGSEGFTINPYYGDHDGELRGVYGTYPKDLEEDIWVFIAPPNRRLYLLTGGEPIYRCGKKPTPKFNGKWGLAVFVPRQAYDLPIDVILTTANSDGSRTLSETFRRWCEVGNFPGLDELPLGVTERMRITLILKRKE